MLVPKDTYPSPSPTHVRDAPPCWRRAHTSQLEMDQISNLWKNIISLFQVVTDDHTIRKMNLETVSLFNLNHTHQFYLIIMNEICLINAFVLHFEIGFTKLHKYVFFKNSPFSPPTRWKQLVLFWPNDPLRCWACMTCTGKFAIKAVERNEKRVMQFSFEGVRFLTWEEQRKLYDKDNKKDKNKQSQAPTASTAPTKAQTVTDTNKQKARRRKKT